MPPAEQVAANRSKDTFLRSRPGCPGNWCRFSGAFLQKAMLGRESRFRAENVMEFSPCVYASIVKAARAGENSRTMPNKDVAVVILAAGKGTRLKSSLAKVLHPA